MIIDFKEIPKANKGGGNQDIFEQFACDLLETLGFEIIHRPDRGADGKKDLIVKELRKGQEGITSVRWLVSCKHFAHSGKSVSDSVELDILDRVKAHKCDGFMGFYSTIPSSGLNNKLAGLDGISSAVYDIRIERQLLTSNLPDRILRSYFPKSYASYLKLKPKAEKKSEVKKKNTSFSEEELFNTTVTAIIILDIGKLVREYFSADWESREKIFNSIWHYHNYNSERITRSALNFLRTAASQTRSNMPTKVAGDVYFALMDFYPENSSVALKFEYGDAAIYIGYNLVYDAFIYLNNYKTAQYGLAIIKYIYLQAIRLKHKKLIAEVKRTYSEIENQLNRAERDDLKPARELIQIFKKDLDNEDLRFPVVPKRLMKLIYKQD